MRMLSANNLLSLALLVAVLCQAQSLEPSLHKNKSSRDINDGTRCSWNCSVLDSDFSEEMKTTFAKKKVVPLVVKYETRVTEKCENHTSRISSGNITEHWQIWLPSKQVSVFAKALESVANLMFNTDSNGDSEEIRAICTLRPVNTTATKPTYDSGSLPIFSRSHLADLGVKFSSIDCNKETTDNLQHCIDITKSTGNNSGTFVGQLKIGGWLKVFRLLYRLFVILFTYYSPAFLSLFSPTEVTEEGVHQIVLDGASPVSPRSLIGNYFFSKKDTIWHRARIFILRGFLLPIPFFVPAIFYQYFLHDIKILVYKDWGFSLNLFHPFMIVSYVCYYIMACFMSFSSEGASERNRPCFFCRVIKSKTLICNENLPNRIRNHLRVQPLILVECLKLFIRYLSTYFERCFRLFPSTLEFSSSFFLRLFLFIVCLSASPAVTILLLLLQLRVFFRACISTSPIVIVVFGVSIRRRLLVYFRRNRYLLLLSYSVCIMIAIPAILGAYVVLSFAAYGVVIAIISAFVLILNEESLPFAACFFLVLYYIWSSYSFFTNKYQDLGLAIFKHYKSYKKSRHSQVTDMNLNTDSLPENTQNSVSNKGNLMKIPKELFHMAYEELMPIRESVCALILKVTLIVSFVFFVFSLIMLHNVSATPVMKALLTFLSGSLPKIVAIFMDGRRQKNIEAMAADEKIPLIVQEYLEGTSAVNQGQENSGVDIDEEMLQDMNEENIELVVM